jgi:hypothetical protein
MKQQHDEIWRDAPLTMKAPYKPYAGKPHVRIWAGGRAMKRTSLPLQRREFIAGPADLHRTGRDLSHAAVKLARELSPVGSRAAGARPGE